jgi:hypothetical protein
VRLLLDSVYGVARGGCGGLLRAGGRGVSSGRTFVVKKERAALKDLEESAEE